MGKGAGTCDGRVAMVLDDGPAAAAVKPKRHGRSGLARYLEETDEQKLIQALENVKSYPEYQVILFRLAQLRDTHAVAGILEGKEYQQAKAAYDKAKKKVEEAQRALEEAVAGLDDADDDKLLDSVRARVLGYDWEYRVALQELVKHPEWKQLQEEMDQIDKQLKQLQETAGEDPVNLDKELKALDRKVKVALIRHGIDSEEFRKLKEQRDALLQGSLQASAEQREKLEQRLQELQDQQTSLRDRLLGDLITDPSGQPVRFAGGELSLTDAYGAYLAEHEAAIMAALEDERTRRKYSRHERERAALEAAQRELEEKGHAFQRHQAALEKAKLRAERAKRRKIILEPQHSIRQLAQDAKKRPHQLRSIFVEDSELRDHLLYLSYNPRSGRYELIAELDHKADEQKLVSRLKKAGAKDITYDLENVPEYSSWAKGVIHGIPAVRLQEDQFELTYTPRESPKGKAPRSEQGQIRLSGKDPEKLLAKMQELGLHKGRCDEVPYNIIYRGDYRYGRVTPLYEPLASGRAALDIPDGHMIIHGLTGAGGDGGVVEHLKKIIETGGLKSIAERRRMGIKNMTMSPLGDIASGIDMGVPCKIGDCTHYGSDIFFALKPEALNRRDLWFSDHDFGGGTDRQPLYEKYAKKLGQKSLHDPCPVEGRQKHLDTGLGSSNEVYFMHEVSWNDVDSLFCSASCGNQVRSVVEEYKRKGLLPEHIRVEVEGQPPAEARKNAKPAGGVGDGWSVTENGEVVFLAGKEERAAHHGYQEPLWSIDEHIQHRARQIASSVE